MNITMTRPIDCLGSISIPKEMRTALNLKNADYVDITFKDGSIEIKPHVESCCICHSKENLKTVLGRYICEDCILCIKSD